jgi:uncharacterized protein (TIGR00106 family)
MKVSVDISIVPIGVGTSVSKYIAECQKIFKEHDLSYQMHGYGTNLEGDWDNVFAAIKACHEELHMMGIPRITDSVRIGTRTDKEQTFDDKIRSVNEKLG